MNIEKIIYKLDDYYIFEISSINNINQNDITIFNDLWNKILLDNKKDYELSYNEGSRIAKMNKIKNSNFYRYKSNCYEYTLGFLIGYINNL
jgi:hypothetical protein